ncbi:YHS domain-containing (seleno)protein [Sediminibacterium sp.]|uniref:YHS domain-containing (seleno)protein n=1 Tax=Sediminibacterium sp. TaxID=1917865 RepID=UPI0025E8D027|nr:YHS domain-containing (seleno)protein [Sediminibacterium sp.]
MIKRILIAILLPILLLSQSICYSQTEKIKKHYNISKQSLAIEGYDPVAYFTNNEAIKGLKENMVSYQGINYLFSSITNKELFKINASKYIPQYGGWCAFAMGSTGEKVEIDPETFKVKDGKLYLFYHSWTNNTLTKGNK